MKPKDQMKTALLICALTSMSPAFANGTMAKADNLNHPTTSIQQQKKVATGRVVDNQGEPLIGVTVMEVGTSNGTVTDLDGKFSLSLKILMARLQFPTSASIRRLLQLQATCRLP